MPRSPLYSIASLWLALSACSPGPAGGLQVLDEDPSTPVDTALPDNTGSICDGRSYPALVINEVLAANLNGVLDSDGETSDWIELLNLDTVAVNLASWGLSDDGDDPLKWLFPQHDLAPGELVLVFASGKDRWGSALHTSFSLDAVEESVLLAAPDGCPVDQAVPGRLYGDISFGRPAATPEAWGYFLDPTPGAANTSESRPGFTPTPVLSPASGFYAAAIDVSVSDEHGAAAVRFTLDGAVPDEQSEPLVAPLAIDARQQPVVVRARAWEQGLWPSRVATATYSQAPALLDDGLSIVSLVVDPFDLYDEETGIYTYGPEDYYPYYPYFDANFWEDWERDVHIQIWEPDGTLVIDQDAGIKIHGGYTRAFEQKSFRILPRSAYGPEKLNYRFFPDEDLFSFDVIVLEGAGDWCPTHTENAFIYDVFRDEHNRRFATIDSQAWEPTVVYLNGQFWGLYAFREKQDEHYVAAHHGVDPDNLDRIECTADGTDNWWRINQGTWDAFYAMDDFAASADLADPQAWETFLTMADVDNLATIVLAEGYWGNTDWWYNNLRLWRQHEDGAPFRWMVFDLGHGWPSYSYDHLATSVGWNGSGLPIAAALENDAFRIILANQAAEFLNTNLAAENALARLDEMHARIEPVMAEQYATWCGQPVSSWYNAVDYAREFVQQRPAVLWRQVMQHLQLDGTAALTVVSDPPGAGTVRFSVIVVEPPFTGDFFRGIPITVTAVPALGWRFVGWAEDDLGDAASSTFTLDGARSVTALFEE